ncbi:MAG TPA: metallophosphoesterase [Kofleriaceae bacterium]|nr:metallophosphoesterase [Kofleriaceae bacterium]
MRRFSTRFGIAMMILGLAHYYVWLRLVPAAQLPSRWHVLATIAIVVLAPSLPVATIALRRLPRATARPYVWLAYTGFGFSVYLLVAAAMTHLACALAGCEPRTAAVVGVGAAVATVVYGVAHAARGPIVRRVRVPLANLPAAADGYTIAQLTDVHIGPLLGERFATRVVAKVNALAPDLIVITGDLVDGRLDELRRHIEPLRDLTARDGVYAVTGNHEYYWNPEAWLEHLRSFGIRILRNQHATIRGAFELAGVDDSSATEDVARALAGRDVALPVVLLAHHPRTIKRAAAAGVDLQLSGHTHGGQLLPLGWLSRLFEPHVAGLARFGATWLYVSEGTGFWGPPMRVGTSSEIALVTLTRT